MEKQTVGVVVGRFQVAQLHAGHRYLLDFVARQHKQLVIVLGVPGSYPTPRNPLSFEMRCAMLGKLYPSATIRPLPDCPNDDEWSKALDAIVKERHPDSDVTVYGSRDSFLGVYSGAFRKVEVPEFETTSGTQIRTHIAKRPGTSEGFRRGVIHTHMTRAPLLYPTVDIAILRPAHNEVLLGAKATDEGKMRFIGGFVGTTDESLELAAKREVSEETSGIEIADLKYVGSAIVRDWRYRGTGDEIMTTLFKATYVFGAPRPADDICTLRWVPLAEMLPLLVQDHMVLGEMLLKSLASVPATLSQQSAA